MKLKILLALVFVSLTAPILTKAQTRSTNTEIGQWREHLSYYYTHNVVKAGSDILIACNSSLFYYNPETKESRTLSKVQGLSDAGIGVVAFDSVSKSAVISYENSNIDIYQSGKVYNIPDIKNRFIEGNKTINNIYFADGKAFLACGFGVVVLDLSRHEIFDTWYVGENSSAISVNSVFSNDTAFFLGTERGLLWAYKNYNTMASSQSWSKKALGNTEINASSDREIRYINQWSGNKIFIAAYNNDENNSMILSYDGQNIDTLIASMYIPFVKTFKDFAAVGTWEGVNIYDNNFQQVFNISQQNRPIRNSVVDYKDILVDGQDIWISHRYQGLINVHNYTEFANQDTIEPNVIIFPEGPASTDVYNLTFTPSGRLYVAPGGRDASLANRYIEGNVFYFENDGWHWINHESYTKKHNIDLRDIVDLTIDPKDDKHIMCASWFNGVVELRNDSIVNIYDSSNTLNYLYPYAGSYRVAAVKYDNSGNLLIANSLTNYNFAFLNYHGQWGGFNTTAFFNTQDQIKGMLVDDLYNYRFIYSQGGKCIIVNNDSLAIRTLDLNNGSLLKTDRINCMIQDKEGEVWIGTEKGIKVIYSLSGAFEGAGSVSPLECNNIVYDEEGIAQYLLSFENIQCILTDGANRKWIGTERNGIYLLSQNGDKELAHFTAENSPLISNKIVCMAQSPQTGEIFIGTDRGLISYRPESLPAFEEKQKLITFPNPVREDYDGLIAIKGFTKDSDVRITDAKGRMVAHLKSLGGQAVWDGRNFNGQKVGSGVYYIFSYSDNNGKTTKADGKFIVIK
ncbi:MAG: hypothetical protein IJ748_00210 [Bacteroidales bacterium]|nr:hypothetical protein [Bacteroidales bacterium]